LIRLLSAFSGSASVIPERASVRFSSAQRGKAAARSGPIKGPLVIKFSRRLLLCNKENIPKPKDRVRLRALLDANKTLFTVVVLKYDLKHLCDFRNPKVARSHVALTA